MCTKQYYQKKVQKKVLEHLRTNGYHLDTSSFSKRKSIAKKKIRKLHKFQREYKLQREQRFIEQHLDELFPFFADGNEITPEKIEPMLIDVSYDKLYANLFRFATLNWSVPVSNGFGRRIRFVIIDKQNSKLMGLIALTDPVFNLKCRDEKIGWNGNDRKKRLIHIMDAYVLGALPPYSNLIGGKLIAALVASKEVQEAIQKKYQNSKSIISKRKIDSRLALITTSSALGKSSVYDRLKINGELLFQKIGETRGYGHFHIPEDIFQDMKMLLKKSRHKYAKGNRFGDGPNWKFRVIRKALDMAGLKSDYLSHGIKREVYLIHLSSNYEKFLKGEDKCLRPTIKSMSEIAEFCKQRWIIPRSLRDGSFKEVKALQTIENMLLIH